MCQLDVFHMCGDAQDPSNYITLCVNCQRLQEAMRGGYLSPAEAADLRDIWRQGELFNQEKPYVAGRGALSMGGGQN
jgi:hypothetical protein